MLINWIARGVNLGQQGPVRSGQARGVARICFGATFSCSASQAVIYLLFLSSHPEHSVQRDRGSDSCDESVIYHSQSDR